jgi:hypothetical protein
MKPRMQLDGTLTGWPQWVRLPWLNGIYFPFWRSVNGARRAAIAMRGGVNLVTDDELCALTERLDEHPDGWDHPCMCAECRSDG